MTLGENAVTCVEQHRNPSAVEGVQLGIGVDVEHLHAHPEAINCGTDYGLGFITEMAVVPADESDEAARHGVTTLAAVMRPVTALVVLGLVVLILGAFLWQLYLADAIF